MHEDAYSLRNICLVVNCAAMTASYIIKSRICILFLRFPLSTLKNNYQSSFYFNWHMLRQQVHDNNNIIINSCQYPTTAGCMRLNYCGASKPLLFDDSKRLQCASKVYFWLITTASKLWRPKYFWLIMSYFIYSKLLLDASKPLLGASKLLLDDYSTASKLLAEASKLLLREYYILRLSTNGCV